MSTFNLTTTAEFDPSAQLSMELQGAEAAESVAEARQSNEANTETSSVSLTSLTESRMDYFS